MKAIITKYHGPANVRGSRYSASDEDGNKVTLSADDSLSSEANHDAAAKALCIKMGWVNHSLACGGMKNQNVYVMLHPDGVIKFTADEQVQGQHNAANIRERLKKAK